MSYSNFRLAELVDQFELNLQDRTDLFAGIPEIEPSDRCKLDLEENVPLAIAMNTEKARSELIICLSCWSCVDISTVKFPSFLGWSFRLIPAKD